MLKRFAHLFAYLLLVLVPLQSIAATNMLVCNSMMQSNAYSHILASSISDETQAQPAQAQSMVTMPCHKHMAAATSSVKDTHQHNCKTTCGALCSTLCAMTALPGGINLTVAPNTSALVSLTEHLYASVSLPNDQRPPIFFS